MLHPGCSYSICNLQNLSILNKSTYTHPKVQGSNSIVTPKVFPGKCSAMPNQCPKHVKQDNYLIAVECQVEGVW